MKINKILLIDESFGSDIPFKFISQNDMAKWNLKGHMEAVNIIRLNKQDEAYWVAWQEILTFAIQTINDADYWLDFSGSLFAVRYTLEEQMIASMYSEKGLLKRA